MTTQKKNIAIAKMLGWKEWAKQYFEFHGDYYISFKELEEGVAYTDLSHYTQEEIEDLYSQYLKQKENAIHIN